MRTGDASDSRLIARTLGAYRLQLVGAPSYFARAGTPSKPEDLLNHACLHHRYPTSGKLQRWPLVTPASGNDVALPVTASSSTIEPLIALAEEGLGVTCVPDFAIRRQLTDGGLVTVLDEYVEHSGVFRAVWPSSPYVSPKLRVFVDFRRQICCPLRMRNGTGLRQEASARSARSCCTEAGRAANFAPMR